MKIEDIIKTLKGVIVTFNIDDKYYKKIEKNKNVLDLWLFTKNTGRKRKFSSKKTINKTILPKKICKLFKKKSVDTVIIDITNIYKYLDDLMYSFNKMTNNVYIYGKLEPYLIKYLINKCNRHYKISYNVVNDNIVLNIDLSNKKNIILKPLYIIYDMFYKIFDYIGTMLMN